MGHSSGMILWVRRQRSCLIEVVVGKRRGMDQMMVHGGWETGVERMGRV